jgi:hypothetical protein
MRLAWNTRLARETGKQPTGMGKKSTASRMQTPHPWCTPVEPLSLVWHRSFVPPRLRRVRLDETLQRTTVFGSFSSEASFQRNLWIPSSAATLSPATTDPPKRCRRRRPQALPLPPPPMTLSPTAAVANPKPCCCRRRPQASWWLVSSPGANLVHFLLKIWFVS